MWVKAREGCHQLGRSVSGRSHRPNSCCLEVNKLSHVSSISRANTVRVLHNWRWSPSEHTQRRDRNKNSRERERVSTALLLLLRERKSEEKTLNICEYGSRRSRLFARPMGTNRGLTRESEPFSWRFAFVRTFTIKYSICTSVFFFGECAAKCFSSRRILFAYVFACIT